MTTEQQISVDLKLSFVDKINLIESIEYWQRERWGRVRKWRRFPDMPLSLKHTMLQREVDLIRSQKKRLKAIRQSIYT